MEQLFYKYQATGNDFILIDNRLGGFPGNDSSHIANLCHRRFGIGADGLILLENDPGADFRMVYFNSDGRPGSMCGNGGRCITAFAKFLGIVGDTCRFVASDGLHEARISGESVSLRMADVGEIRHKKNYSFLNTGSPHHVQEVSGLEAYDVDREGKRLRYSLYGEPGSNINFVELQPDGVLHVRTYERGVEAETYSCGTGVTAAAIAMEAQGKHPEQPTRIRTRGGDLEVAFRKDAGAYTDIWLTGPARMVFKGTLS
ncbi:diaminopimelate epimerase [Robiginitalea biformata]|uniref:Diaminopimelate epimerase n=1 Tax=Robiginitalea biformata (strain ATCC BAA-864 / DSM 15991 / KCTC 12146 / HTCC2501) TaxID=313596 RepID=A4CLX3_ROBBH|nr:MULTISPECIES: diaminopimelate epimerase [unclassified Robiginitalea]EAR15872.1 diaminopimelate epimerase [Robiginitalea biformata HTCC2501]MDC6354295.1 diaminopimelate epimerase [Robiginitalea sp. PM2]MDC6374562.1 diaminopimelate epimerase [Robiginitalea sp. SP8]